jgi:hypothetical protein
MRIGSLAFAIFSLAFWLVAAFVLILAATAPCGLAPGAWCELEGSPWWGVTLAAIGPLGVLIAAAILYAFSIWLYSRKQKGR